MQGHQASRRYAKALYTQASAGKCVPHVVESAQVLSQVLTPSVLAHFSNPAIAKANKLAALDEATKAAPQLLRAFVRLMAQDGRADLLAEALAAFQNIVDSANSHTSAKVVSAVKLTDKQRSSLIEQALKMSGTKTVALEEVVDPSVIAGVRLHVGSQLWDATVQGKMNRLGQQMAQGYSA